MKLIGLLDKFYKQEGKSTMTIIGEVVIKVMLTKLFEKAYPPIKRMLEEVLPPTPLYITALLDAEKDVRRLWMRENNEPPKLNIKEALSDFSKKQFDSEILNKDTSFLKNQVTEALLKHIVGDRDVQDFVERVIAEADKKLLKTICSDDKREAALLKQYIVQVAMELKVTQAEILDRLETIGQTQRNWFVKFRDKVNTVDEILAQQIEFPEVPTKTIMNEIKRKVFEDRYRKLWSEWRQANNLCEDLRLRIHSLEEKEVVEKGLNQFDQQELKDFKRQFEVSEQKYAQAITNLLALIEDTENKGS